MLWTRAVVLKIRTSQSIIDYRILLITFPITSLNNPLIHAIKMREKILQTEDNLHQ